MSKIAISDLEKASAHNRLSHLEAINVMGGQTTVKGKLTIGLELTFEKTK